MSEMVVIALIGDGVAVIGSVATLADKFIKCWLEERVKLKKEEPAKALLQ